jgi:hypothetical protein
MLTAVRREINIKRRPSYGFEHGTCARVVSVAVADLSPVELGRRLAELNFARQASIVIVA